MLFLGIDTSNYTTSTALYDTEQQVIFQQKKLLPVKKGEKGLRQSDAVFHHTVQLPQMMEALFTEHAGPIQKIGVSVFPRREQGSYMPCFLVGQSVAVSLGAAMQTKPYTFSHQEGHIAAALFATGKMDLLNRTFLAFHVSGGTTEALLVHPDDDHIIRAECVARSLDLKAGQLIDRVGVMLDMQFPCGVQLDALSQNSDKAYKIKPTMKDCDCCLSGLENQCQKLFKAQEAPADIAKYCLSGVLAALCGMTDALRLKYGDLPLVFSGGVSSNTLLQTELSKRYGAYFAPPAFSADNAAGIAVLTALQYEKEMKTL